MYTVSHYVVMEIQPRHYQYLAEGGAGLRVDARGGGVDGDIKSQ
jgi:hypothetical protein